ncbi:hypothetical protein BJY01DRAFT_230536 [Aspergillus pseudoustus]|uniref:Uncharacterized protein n=1 Tax=Aspergillus pseudoustus TaxID=1810923 RepID=A0ABR4I8W5_9EURO
MQNLSGDWSFARKSCCLRRAVSPDVFALRSSHVALAAEFSALFPTPRHGLTVHYWPSIIRPRIVRSSGRSPRCIGSPGALPTSSSADSVGETSGGAFPRTESGPARSATPASDTATTARSA